MKNKDIAVLVEKVQKSKAEHFEELYKETWKTVYYYCYKNLRNEKDAEDAMQTVYLQLYSKIDSLYHSNAFNSFLCTIMRYTCSNLHRAKFKSESEDLEKHEAILQEENADFLPNEAYEREEVRNKIAVLVESLPEKQREAILLFYFEDKSIKEIAEITDSKFDAVNNRLVTARKTLRERVEELIRENGPTTFSLAPLPVLTRILREEAERLATDEIGAEVWKSIADGLGLEKEISDNDVQNPAKSTAGINAAIYATVVAVAVVAGAFIYYVYDNFFAPPTAPVVYEEHAYEDYIDFAMLIPQITDRPTFIEFTDMFGFSFLGGAWTSRDGYQMLYYLDYAGKTIYLGYMQNLQGTFQVRYEIAEGDLSRISSDEVGLWFLR